MRASGLSKVVKGGLCRGDYRMLCSGVGKGVLGGYEGRLSEYEYLRLSEFGND